MSVVLEFLFSRYYEAYNIIKEESGSHFTAGFWFVALWILILGIFAGLVLLTIYFWIGTVILVGILIVIEILCMIGRKLKTEKTKK